MAIQSSYQTVMGFIAPEAYIRIVRFRGDKSNIDVQLEIYYNQAAKELEMSPVGSMNMKIELPDGATMQQMYDTLKLLPEFSGAQDC